MNAISFFSKIAFDGRSSKKVNNIRFPKEEGINIEERVENE